MKFPGGKFVARILLIEDQEQDRLNLKSVLENAGYDVVEASKPQEGLMLFRQRPADLLLISLDLPQKKGLAIVQELNHEYAPLKTIALTGKTGLVAKTLEIYARVFGAMYVVRKPVQPDKLLTTINGLIGTTAS